MKMTTSPNTTRRDFLASGGAMAAAATLANQAWAYAEPPAPDQAAAPSPPPPKPPTPTQPAQKSEGKITTSTIAEAEKLAGVSYTDEERAMIAEGIEEEIDRYLHRREFTLPNGLGPAQVFSPLLPGMTRPANQRPWVRRKSSPGPLPSTDEDIAFAPVTHLASWIKNRKLTSTRLTRIYLDRLKQFDAKLECVITLTEDLALKQARRADDEIKRGKYRGPLHGIPWGAKDLLDTKGILTTWGAAPYKTRVSETDAAVVKKLDEAGAVLVAKLTLGALAYGDIWFGGRTNNPFNLKQGSSGSSAGPAAAAVAGLVGFGIGTETLGSIVSPSMRCGATGLRPTFGRVPRSGAMALCWSLDKIGPLCRSVEDALLVLDAIRGSDDGDPASVDLPLNFEANRPLSSLTLGYNPKWFEPRKNKEGKVVFDPELDRNTLETARELGLKLVEIELPEWPYDALVTILLVEAAAAFEELTLSNRDDELKWQAKEAWPNTFRQSRFTPGIEYVQADRFRRRVCEMMAGQFQKIDAIIAPSFANSLLLITNNTGHPSLTIRNGFQDNGNPHGLTLIGNLYEEGTLCHIGMALEKELGVSETRPTLS